MKNIELTDSQLDALKEVGNIGAGHASASLAQLINKRVSIRVPRAYTVSIEKIPYVVGGPENFIVGNFFQIVGDVNGNILLAFPKEQALYLSNILLAKEGDAEFITPDKESAMQELGNILASSYLTALSNFLGINLKPSVPHLAYDMAGAVVDILMIEMSQNVEHALVIETEFVVASNTIAGQFLVFFDSEGFNTILKAIGMHEL